jgi:hypothetical protein
VEHSIKKEEEEKTPHISTSHTPPSIPTGAMNSQRKNHRGILCFTSATGPKFH